MAKEDVSAELYRSAAGSCRGIFDCVRLGGGKLKVDCCRVVVGRQEG